MTSVYKAIYHSRKGNFLFMYMMSTIFECISSQRQSLIIFVWVGVVPCIFYFYSSYGGTRQPILYAGNSEDRSAINAVRLDTSVRTYPVNGTETNGTGFIYRNVMGMEDITANSTDKYRTTMPKNGENTIMNSEQSRVSRRSNVTHQRATPHSRVNVTHQRVTPPSRINVTHQKVMPPSLVNVTHQKVTLPSRVNVTHQKVTSLSRVNVTQQKVTPPSRVNVTYQKVTPPSRVNVTNQKVTPPSRVNITHQNITLPSRVNVTHQKVTLPSRVNVTHQKVTLPSRVNVTHQKVTLPSRVNVTHQKVTLPTRVNVTHQKMMFPSRVNVTNQRVTSPSKVNVTRQRATPRSGENVTHQRVTPAPKAKITHPVTSPLRTDVTHQRAKPSSRAPPRQIKPSNVTKDTTPTTTHIFRNHSNVANATTQPTVVPTTQLPWITVRIPFQPFDHKKISVNCSQIWVSSHMAGRLGNQMCEYAHLLLFHLEYGIQVGLMSPMHSALKKIFPNLSIQLLPKECLRGKHLPTHSWPTIDSLIKDKKLQGPAISGGFPCNATRLWRYRDIWRREFTFQPQTSKKAQSTINTLLVDWKKKEESIKTLLPPVAGVQAPVTTEIQDPLVVGVHVRRSDYITYLRRTTGAQVLGKGYFKRAFEYFRRKYGNVVFLVSSDDRNWCKMNLVNKATGDVIITPKGSATDDMALLSFSSHLIMSLGTYGFWAGALSHGVVTFPMRVGKRNEYFMTKNMRMVNSTDIIALSP